MINRVFCPFLSVVLCLFVTMVGCTPAEQTALSPLPSNKTLTPSLVASSTITIIPTTTLASTFTEIPTSTLLWSNAQVTPLATVLPPGLYLASVPNCEESTGPECIVTAFTLNGKVSETIATIPYRGIGLQSFVYNNHRLAFIIVRADSYGNQLPDVFQVIDLGTGDTFGILSPEGENCTLEDWSPDGTHLIALCKGRPEIDLISVPDGKLTTILDYSRVQNSELVYDQPRWSPDGKWLLFYEVAACGGCSFHEERYVMDMSCLSDLSTCRDAIRPLSSPGGENFVTSSSWTPDSHLAWILSNEIEVYDVESGQRLRTYYADPNGGKISQVAWSPDSKWIAIRQDNLPGMLVLSTQGNESLHLNIDVSNPFWISVP